MTAQPWDDGAWTYSDLEEAYYIQVQLEWHRLRVLSATTDLERDMHTLAYEREKYRAYRKSNAKMADAVVGYGSDDELDVF